MRSYIKYVARLPTAMHGMALGIVVVYKCCNQLDIALYQWLGARLRCFKGQEWREPQCEQMVPILNCRSSA